MDWKFKNLRSELLKACSNGYSSTADIDPINFLFKNQKLSFYEVLFFTNSLISFREDIPHHQSIFTENNDFLDLSVLIINGVIRAEKCRTLDPFSKQGYLAYLELLDFKKKLTDLRNQYSLKQQEDIGIIKAKGDKGNNFNRALKVGVISTTDIEGGAAIAAYRLHSAINKSDTAVSRMLVMQKKLSDTHAEQVVLIDNNQLQSFTSFLENSELDRLSSANQIIKTIEYALGSLKLGTDYLFYSNINKRTNISNTLFSGIEEGIDISEHPLIEWADVINIHWSTYFLSSSSMRALIDIGKPIILTMHDMRYVTGGCHYSARCTNYYSKCHSCPQVSTEIGKLMIADAYNELFSTFKGANNLTITAPSEWLRDIAAKSPMFHGVDSYHIPNSISETFIASNNLTLSSDQQPLLGAPKTPNSFLFVASGLSESRKGAIILLDALKSLIEQYKKKLIKNKSRIALITLGLDGDIFNTLDPDFIDVIHKGYVQDEVEVMKIYGMAEYLILPTLDDNYPNVIIESLLSSTPVIAFDSGGCREVINKDNNFGVLVEDISSQGLASAMLDVLENGLIFDKLGVLEYVRDNNLPSIQADRYIKLFKEKLFSLNKLDKAIQGGIKAPDFALQSLSERISFPAPELIIAGDRISQNDALNQSLLGRYEVIRIRVVQGETVHLRFPEKNKDISTSSLLIKNYLMPPFGDFYLVISIGDQVVAQLANLSFKTESILEIPFSFKKSSNIHPLIEFSIINKQKYGVIGDVVFDVMLT
ncbi:glycosyltransferase [Polynucleobacter paneuropaeus]|nr:glycosyltransferase [Polynucleobacter paneuropaeus]MBT8530963.1 glycosyltransferase [Polynucleobacter paneuropaeus]MBT8602480.1 glycosyltransferase [Polynucleobacter paneuropaeus]MBT8624433.1 glycosyltransferase [Polynucleobacter paneuropaeus]MBT8628682.1 glycosyltransferase [Polynucleobacter paneuropaeus]